MVKVLEDFPEVHQTFNLVPSMLVQIEEYASGVGSRPVSPGRAEARRGVDGARAGLSSCSTSSRRTRRG